MNMTYQDYATFTNAKNARDTAMTATETENGRTKKMIDKYHEVEIEQDGFITRPETLERINAAKAKPAKECAYPDCENCDNYHGHYCTVPMVVSKQIWRLTEDLIVRMEKRLTELENLVTDEILGSER